MLPAAHLGCGRVHHAESRTAETVHYGAIPSLSVPFHHPACQNRSNLGAQKVRQNRAKTV